MKYQKTIVTTLAVSLLACSTTNSSYSASHSAAAKNRLPKVAAKTIPGGVTSNWRYLGTTSDGLVAIEINESSIATAGGVNQFQDRKTILKPQQFSYSKQTARYKFSLSWWQLDCQQKSFLITASSIFDNYGKLIKNYNFNESSWSEIEAGSIAERQSDYVCHGINRNLGY